MQKQNNTISSTRVNYCSHTVIIHCQRNLGVGSEKVCNFIPTTVWQNFVCGTTLSEVSAMPQTAIHRKGIFRRTDDNVRRTKSPVAESRTGDRVRCTLTPYQLGHSVTINIGLRRTGSEPGDGFNWSTFSSGHIIIIIILLLQCRVGNVYTLSIHLGYDCTSVFYCINCMKIINNIVNIRSKVNGI